MASASWLGVMLTARTVNLARVRQADEFFHQQWASAEAGLSSSRNGLA